LAGVKHVAVLNAYGAAIVACEMHGSGEVLNGYEREGLLCSLFVWS